MKFPSLCRPCTHPATLPDFRFFSHPQRRKIPVRKIPSLTVCPDSRNLTKCKVLELPESLDLFKGHLFLRINAPGVLLPFPLTSSGLSKYFFHAHTGLSLRRIWENVIFSSPFYTQLHLLPEGPVSAEADGEVKPGSRGGGKEGKGEVWERGLPEGCEKGKLADRETACLHQHLHQHLLSHEPNPGFTG